MLLDISPTSHQTKNKKLLNQIKNKIKQEISDDLCKEFCEDFWNKPVFIKIFFFLPKEFIDNKDIDNMAKPVLMLWKESYK